MYLGILVHVPSGTAVPGTCTIDLQTVQCVQRYPSTCLNNTKRKMIPTRKFREKKPLLAHFFAAAAVDVCIAINHTNFLLGHEGPILFTQPDSP